MRIGVYCGSFAPVHYGHMAIARAAIDQGFVDKVLIVPTGNYWDKEIALDLDLRIKCLKVHESADIIIDEDVEDCYKSLTYELFERLKPKYPDDVLVLLVGGDNIINFDKWYNYQYLLDHYPMVVMPRVPVLKEDVDRKMQKLGKKDYGILTIETMEVSSSFIRSNLNNRELVVPLIGEKVFQLLNE